MTTMLYKWPGPHDIHGDRYDYKIVPDDEIQAALAAGWHLTTTDAKANAKKVLDVPPIPGDDEPPTREELEQKARELGIQFDGRTRDHKLSKMIADALGG